jgi:hypothetical protein
MMRKRLIDVLNIVQKKLGDMDLVIVHLNE